MILFYLKYLKKLNTLYLFSFVFSFCGSRKDASFDIKGEFNLNVKTLV